MLSLTLLAALSYSPATRSVVHSHAPAARARPLVALADWVTPDAVSTLVATSQMPAGFEFASAPHGPKFSHVLMEAVSAYTLLSGAQTFAPIIKRKLSGEKPMDAAAQLAARLASVRAATRIRARRAMPRCRGGGDPLPSRER